MKSDQCPIQKEEEKSRLNGTIVDANINVQITEIKTSATQTAVATDPIEATSGPGDLLVEDTNATRNAENASPYENGNKLDDSTSLSSSSSNVANIELEDDLSDDMTLRISEDEDGGSESKKDSLQYASIATSPVPTADNLPLSENYNSNSQFDNLNKISKPPVVNQVLKSKESDSGTSNNTEHANSMQIDKISSDEHSFDLKESKSNVVINEISSNDKDISRPETDEKTLDNKMDSCEIPSQIVDSSSDLTISELRKEIEDFIKSDDTDKVASPKLQLTADKDKASSLGLSNDPMEVDVISNLDTEAMNKGISEIEATKSTTTDLDVNLKENTNNKQESNINDDEKAASISNSNIIVKLLNSEKKCVLNISDIKLGDSSNNNSDNTKMTEENISVLNEMEFKQTCTESADAISQDSVPKIPEISSDVAKEPESDESNDLLVPMEVSPIESDMLNEETSEEGTSSPVDKSSESSETVADITSSLLEVLRETETSEDVILETNGKSVISEELNSPLDTAVDSLEKKICNESMDTEILESIPEQISENKAEIDVSKESNTASIDIATKLIDSELIVNSDVDTSKTDSVAIQKLDEGKDVEKTDAESVNYTTETIKDELKEEDDSKELNDTVKPSTLKRSLENTEEDSDAKKLKFNGSLIKTCEKIKKVEYVTLAQFKQFMDKRKIEFMTRDDLEEFVIQKMCEVINQDSRIAELSRAIRLHEQHTDILRNRFGIMAKQVKDLEIVHTRIIQEVRTKAKEGGNIKEATPVKITRSVGLQVSLQPIAPVRIRPGPEPDPSVRLPPVPKRRNHRASLPSKLPTTPPSVQPLGPPVAPAPKPVTSSPKLVPSSLKPPSTVTPAATKGIKTILPKVYAPAVPKVKDAQTNGPVLANYLQKPAGQTSPVRKTIETPKVIDLTDEDDTNKATINIPTSNIRVIASHQLTNTVNTPSTSTVTSVSNTNLPRLTYFVQTPGQPGQPVLLATSSAPTRPGQPRPTLMFKPVPSGQVPSGQRLNLVRPAGPGTINVLQSNTPQNIRPGQQIRYTNIQPAQGQQSVISRPRHPAPLPGPPAVQPSQPNWKAMPPKPNLKISRVGDGIVLSWKMLNKEMSRYEEIASYQLYAYQETNGAPSTEMWRKVGDVKALALPMACTLTQFTDGNKYHFAVRAVDVKSRVGPFSPPEQIALP